MSTYAGKKAESTPTAASAPDKAEVNLERRRALVQAGWAVPAILAIGLPSRESKALGPTGSPVGLADSGATPVAQFTGGSVDPVDPVNPGNPSATAIATSTNVTENTVIIEIFSP
jgi:hypothetical protein